MPLKKPARLVNLTPHPIHLYTKTGVLVLPPSGTPARMAQRKAALMTLTMDGREIPVTVSSHGGLAGLPPPEDGVYYIVALPIAQVLQGARPDVLALDDYVRDDEGRIIGAKALSLVQ